ncbi:hypothetical protein U8C37_06680 [Sinorhizobium medicae]|uniref:hypothetical protein n=1 Tax=Sinorhizobium medicae TaxID=110321 RepID=UPI002AF6A682|nr:hypothetical protein [Sinorhizobium medicae]WQO87053.1 hypothetical protein U8C37_06680 [Sinorhizobium medicae]
MKSKLLIFAAALALSGCVTQEQFDKVMASQRPPSAAEKAAIVSAARDYFVDPYSIRDAEISNVVRLNDQGLEAVCVKANAKNRMGGYTGRTATSVRLLKGKPMSTLENAPACAMPQMRYRPFPELENLKNV